MEVRITKKAAKALRKAPKHVVRKLKVWKDRVEVEGIEQVRKTPGYHDEPLQGQRKGQRSIRLSQQYRAFYIEGEDGTIRFVSIIEVNPHEY